MVSLGAHESVAGGLHLAFDRLRQVGGEALQIFTRNQRQWNPPPLTAEEIVSFQTAWQGMGCPPVASHASYLINLATGKPELAAKSIAAFQGEILRCRQLGIPFVVIHPGSHGGDGVDVGLARFTTALDLALDAGGPEVTVLLETTAGQGTSLGSRFEELAFVLTRSRHPQRLGVCVDTCHIFAAGYDIRTLSAYNATMDEFERLVGIRRIKFFHLNDSKTKLAGRVDRHEHIGQGAIGVEGFRWLLNDPRFANHPMTLETAKSDDLHEDYDNLQVLRGLINTPAKTT
jgi:deoxyribonuclease-4